MKTAKNMKIDRTNSFDVFNTVIMGLLAFITIFPFYYVIIVSVAKYEDIMKQLIYLVPKALDFGSYKMILSTNLISNALFVTLFITIFGTLLSMAASVAGAYALSKKGFPGRKVIYALVIFTMFFSGGLIPYYLIVKATGLINNIFAMIIPIAVNTFYVILLKNYFEEMPASIEESAKIDGANDLYILYKIIIPTAAPVIATICLFYAVDKWNEYYSAILFISDNKKYPLQMVLREIILNYTQLKGVGAFDRAVASRAVYTKSVQMAVVVLTTVPILVVYPFIQKYFTKGIMFGSVKE